MNDSTDQSRDFWNNRAKTFPRFNDEPQSYENSMLDLVRNHCLDFKGKTVLDVGCGTGLYTLKIAFEALKVTALDLSDQMLEINRQDCLKLGLQNVKYVLSSFSDYQTPERFDIVFCSMCPAINNESSRIKLVDLTGEALIFIGFQHYVDPGILVKLFDYFKIERHILKNGPEMRYWLQNKGYRFASYLKSGQWYQERDLDDALNWCRMRLEAHGIKDPDERALIDSIAPFFNPQSGLYNFDSPYEVEMLIWERNKNLGLT
ncbi:MAG: class I SAM-dependent methyltransferase [Deltaproteobacteria bacterium]|jgi:SAM-dependent methyltransferase|nr:class I SAM-dependent methyltransferase [Deltaproteobacteria bacterium]